MNEAMIAAFEATNDQLTKVVRELATLREDVRAFGEEIRRDLRRAEVKSYFYNHGKPSYYIDCKLVGLRTMRIHVTHVEVFNDHVMLLTDLGTLDSIKSWLGSLRDKVQIFLPNENTTRFVMIIPIDLIEITTPPVSLRDYTLAA